MALRVGEHEEVAAPPQVPRVDLRSAWRPAALFTASRGLVLLAFVAAGAVKRGLTVHHASVLWDSGLYLDIARSGYPDHLPHGGTSLIAFYPGLPLLVRALMVPTGLSVWRAGMIVVFASGLAASCGIWFLTRELADAASADRATALFAFAPGSFVLSMAYSECVLVCFGVAACWALIRRRWVLAGVLAAVGAAARPDGIGLALAAGCAAYVAIKHRHEMRALAAPALALGGAVAVQLYFWIHTGQMLVFFHAERQGWHQTFTPGTGRIDDVRNVLHAMVHGGPVNWNNLTSLLGLGVFAIAFVLLVRWRAPIELIAFSVSQAFFAITSSHVGFRPRLVMATFPLAIALGVRLRRGPWFAVVLGASAACMVMLAVVSVTTHLITP